MEFLELAKKRFSVRKFEDKPVEEEKEEKPEEKKEESSSSDSSGR